MVGLPCSSNATPLGIFFLFLAGLMFTAYLGVPQLRYFYKAWKVIGAGSKRGQGPGEMSHFQAFCVSLSGAVGLGNILRFPHVVAKSGGSSFLVIYLAAVLLLAFPLMLFELSIGRKYGKDPWSGLKKAAPKSSVAKFIGLLPVLVAFFILSYYSSAVGWTLLHTVSLIFYGPLSLQGLLENSLACMLSTTVILVICTTIILQGVSQGIEKICRKNNYTWKKW